VWRVRIKAQIVQNLGRGSAIISRKRDFRPGGGKTGFRDSRKKGYELHFVVKASFPWQERGLWAEKRGGDNIRGRKRARDRRSKEKGHS